MDASKRWPVWPEAVGRELDDATRAFKDVLDGLALFYESPFIRDIRNTLLAHPDSAIGIALNKKQTACKKWLVEELYAACGPTVGTVHVLAGWYGLLGAMLLADPRLQVEKLTVIDIDPACAPVAACLNASHVATGRFAFACHDIHALDYAALPEGLTQPDVIINTACEHLEQFDSWYGGLPEGTLLVLQSNDYVAIPEHVNCAADLAAFEAQTPMRERLFAGELRLDKYTRFMVIGRK
ncbi:MAG: hypothetical protein Kow0032_02910 [Methyloligellaceae bacterium]